MNATILEKYIVYVYRYICWYSSIIFDYMDWVQMFVYNSFVYLCVLTTL